MDSSSKFPLGLLPEHILVEIFKNFSVDDLKSIISLNSDMYRIISSNSILNQRFCLKLNNLGLFPEREQPILQAVLRSSRNFESVVINNAVSEKTDLILEKCGANISYLFMRISGLPVNMIGEILKLTPNVKTLITHTSSLKDEAIDQPPYLKKLKHLTMYTRNEKNNLVMKLLSNVTSLEYCNIVAASKFGIQELVSRQCNLKELYIYNIEDNRPNMFEMNLSQAKPKFFLHTFHYQALHLLSESAEMSNLATFLRSQLHLKDIKIILGSAIWRETIQAIISLPNLKTLYLNLKDSSSWISALQDLHCRNNGLGSMKLRVNCLESAINIVNSFVGLKHLDLKLCEAKVPESKISFDHLENLQSIKFTLFRNEFSLLTSPGIQMKNLKELNLSHVRGMEIKKWQTFIASNSNIKVIRIFGGHNVCFETLALFTANLKQLQVLEIDQTVAGFNDASFEEFILSCKNLKELKLTLGVKEDFDEILKKIDVQIKQMDCTFNFLSSRNKHVFK